VWIPKTETGVHRQDGIDLSVHTSQLRWLSQVPEYMLGDELDELEPELPPMFGQFAELRP
jgi:hypothetical protein